MPLHQAPGRTEHHIHPNGMLLRNICCRHGCEHELPEPAARPTCCWCLSLKYSIAYFWSYLISYCPVGDVTDDVAVLRTSDATVEARSRAFVVALVVVRSTMEVSRYGGAGVGGSGGGGPGQHRRVA